MPKRKTGGRHRPQGVHILYEDRDILVVEKAPGILTMASDSEKEKTVYYRLTDYVRKGSKRSRERIFIVHRLDRDVSGVLVFAKTGAAKANLIDQWEHVEKKYLAVVHGKMAQKTGMFSSYLTEDKAHYVFSTPDPEKGMLSHTAYRVLKEARGLSLLEINLLTGRKNQIRVHLSENGHPIVGDRKYGKEETQRRARLALHAKSISFTHPYTGKRVRFETETPAYFKTLIGDTEAETPSPAP